MIELKHKKYIIGIILFSALFMGCGQDHQARSLIKDFVKSDMSIEDFDILQWSDIQSAHFVSDSIIQVMRQRAVECRQVKPSTKYHQRTDDLKFIHVKYVTHKDTVKQTFYLDDAMTGIVSFKTD